MSGPGIHGRTHVAGGTDPIPGSGGSGIDFDTYPQDGGWLYAETTDSTTAPNSFAIELNDSSGDAENPGVYIHSDNGQILIVGDTIGIGMHSGYQLTMSLFGGMHLTAPVYEMASSVTVMHQADAGTIKGHRFTIPASGGVFEVIDSNGQALFRVDGDGDLHGLTGKALTFDL